MSNVKTWVICTCDVPLGNIMLYDDEHDRFLTDLDIAAPIQPSLASGAPTKTGTKVFMSIGALLGSQHSFMDDIESVLLRFGFRFVHIAQGLVKRGVLLTSLNSGTMMASWH